MPRADRHRVPADAGLFDPLQLQPAAVGRITFDAGTRWLRRHLISHRRLLTECGTGLVVWSVRIRYERALGFADTEELGVRTQVMALCGGGQVRCEVAIDDGRDTRPAVRASLVLIPLRIEGEPSLAGNPAALDPRLLKLFRHDELLPVPHTSPVPRLRRELGRLGAPRARASTAFRIHRHMCEMADQWFWPTALTLAATGRAELIRGCARPPERVPDGLSRPVRTLDVLLERPFYLFDEGRVVSSVWSDADGPTFVHELRSGDSERGLEHGWVVERW
ncbi:hypothetical protein [Actinomadura rubrisoli]|uniref:Thioesterase family protein n=1 Tax=Actinomadura rubrisoli TaxID=2530368 RepID=A0A4R5BRF3_9ACTN|nr:hypothetical protein [Actinomadura rubrisoli]TDD87830.1 hypothetical protein E1298_15650 [Actinomadura rubrisoli]